jgi:hypothetical protein
MHFSTAVCVPRRRHDITAAAIGGNALERAGGRPHYDIA